MRTSVMLTARLTAEEFTRLKEMASSDVAGCDSISDFLRLLLHRESNRRKNLSKPVTCDYQGVFRGGFKKRESRR